MDDSEFKIKNNINIGNNKIKIDVKDFKIATEFLINWLNEQKYFDKIKYIGHRIFHGMEHAHPEIIDDNLLKEINRISDYDPDHLPAEIQVIQFFKNSFPAYYRLPALYIFSCKYAACCTIITNSQAQIPTTKKTKKR